MAVHLETQEPVDCSTLSIQGQWVSVSEGTKPVSGERTESVGDSPL